MESIFRRHIIHSIPLSHSQSEISGGLRRRLSSLNLNLNIHPVAADWAFRRSKSVSSLGQSAGNSLKKWWDSVWDWILSRKPSFAVDLEMHEEEYAALGAHNKGSWRHILFKITSQLTRKLLRGDDLALPHTFCPDSGRKSRRYGNTVH